MQNVKSILEDLKHNFPDWEQKLQENDDFTTYEDEVLGHRMLDLVFAFKRLCKERESCALEIFSEWITDPKTAEILRGKVEVVLVYYNAFRPLREMLLKNPENVKELLEDAFFHYVLRWEPDIVRRWRIRDEEGENRMEEILQALDNLTDYYTKRLYTQKTVKKDFEDETGLSEECCELYAKLYEEHFHELKLNMILNGLVECQAQLQQMQDFL